jgi:hypothetical protein
MVEDLGLHAVLHAFHPLPIPVQTTLLWISRLYNGKRVLTPVTRSLLMHAARPAIVHHRLLRINPSLNLAYTRAYKPWMVACKWVLNRPTGV